jgi:hypothetical protein
VDVLDARAAWAYLGGLNCTTAWVGAECPPGDSFKYGARPRDLEFVTPEAYDRAAAGGD